MNLNDDKLANLMQKWQGIEVSGAFEQDVLRKINRLKTDGLGDDGNMLIYEVPVMRVIYAAAAAFAGILIGISGAMTVLPEQRMIEGNLFKPFPERNISASFINLMGKI